jgi:hypothetical protein
MQTYHKRAPFLGQSMARLKQLARYLVNKDRLPFGFQRVERSLLRDQSKFFIFHRQAIKLLASPAN